MRLILKVVCFDEECEVETGREMVELLGMQGAIKMLKNRAFGANPSFKRSDSTVEVTFHDAVEG